MLWGEKIGKLAWDGRRRLLKSLQDLPPAPPHPFVTDMDRQGRILGASFFVLMSIRYSANCTNDGY